MKFISDDFVEEMKNASWTYKFELLSEQFKDLLLVNL